MPGFTFPSAGRLGLTSPLSRPSGHRYYVPPRLPSVRLPSVRFSLSSRDTPYRPSFFVSPSGFAGRRSLPCQRREFVSRPALPDAFILRGETDGSLKFPDCPHEHMPWSRTPVVTRMLTLSHPGLPPSVKVKTSAFPSLLQEVIH